MGAGARDASGPAEETRDAIRDHDDIRDALREAGRHRVGSQDWWEAVRAARLANSDHMAEEEREALADFRRNATLAERHDRAVEFAVYAAANSTGVPLRDRDPDRYLAEHGG